MSQITPDYFAAPPIAGDESLLTPPKRRISGDGLLRGAATSSAVLILLMLAGLIAVLTVSAVPSIRTFGMGFITGREWRPNELEQPKHGPDGKVIIEDGEVVTETLPPAFGALPVIWGTAVSSVLALAFAVPMSFGASIFLVRIAAKWLAGPISFLIEFLAAIPSIAYGIWGLFVLCPFLQSGIALWRGLSFLGSIPGLHWAFVKSSDGIVHLRGIESMLNDLFLHVSFLHFLATPSGGVTGRDMLAGGLILGIMIVPIITALSRDVLRNVPRAQIEGTVALGATWWQSSMEMLKFSRSGLFGAIMLGLARAAGETMAITMVIGNNSQIKSSIFAPAQTMSSLLANEFAEASTDLHRSALTEVALILLLMSLLFNVVARYLIVGKSARTSAAH